MGRVNAGRHLQRRPFLVFAVLLLGPAIGFCLLSWNSVRQEHTFRLREMDRVAQDVLQQRLDATVADLDRLRTVEEQRHYYEFQDRFIPREIQYESFAFQDNALTDRSGDERVLGWFQWELGAKGVFEAPQVFAQDKDRLRQAITASYGPYLRGQLATAAQKSLLTATRVESYPLHVIAANEERGQLQEELDLLQRRQQADVQEIAGPGAQQRASGSAYIDSYRRRIGTEQVEVRRTEYRYVAADVGAPAPPLVAWRLVWIPAAHAQNREVRRDRWLLQGYALDPFIRLTAGWQQAGQAQLARVGAVDADGAGLSRASLAEEIDAVLLANDGGPAALELVARPDYRAAEDAWTKARTRFLLLIGALVVVVALGFFVLMRSVRREIALARRKEDFIAAITHELKTPLTGIRMYADMLRQGWVTSTEAAEGYADKILDETRRLGNLVDQVLDLAALERGVAEASAELGDIGDAVEQAVALMAPKAAEAGVELNVEVEPDLGPVSFDPKLLRPLVLNLVDNAIKYSGRSDTKSVDVDVVRDGERVVVRVTDRGVGISREARKQLFEPFHRSGDELTRDAPGVGIGMALVKRYADAHRARILVESEEGRGTSVAVRFPRGL